MRLIISPAGTYAQSYHTAGAYLGLQSFPLFWTENKGGTRQGETKREEVEEKKVEEEMSSKMGHNGLVIIHQQNKGRWRTKKSKRRNGQRFIKKWKEKEAEIKGLQNLMQYPKSSKISKHYSLFTVRWHMPVFDSKRLLPVSA